MKNRIHKLSWAVAACCSVLLMTSGCGGGEDKGPKAIVVWNPFVISTLASREDVRVLFDSTKIPNEIVDSVVVAKSSLEKPGGEAFACAVIETFYEVNKAMADPAKRDDTLKAIGQKFAAVSLEDMEKVVKQTKFYGTPDEGIAVLKGAELPKTMETVVGFCESHGIVDQKPSLGFGDAGKVPDAALRFDASYIEKVKKGETGTPAPAPPTFSLAWSEYPSWSVFGVADSTGIINGKKGELGPIEKKWGVDIELKEAEYDPCLAMYGAGQCDAVCITNMDILQPSLGRPGVMVLPTSTSFGADACIVTSDIKTVEDLKGVKVYGLEKSVSEYCFVRNLELLKQAEKDYSFSNMDPAAAALAMQQKAAVSD